MVKVDEIVVCSFDTNIILRWILGDNLKQLKLINNILESTNFKKAYISDVAILECVWVMQSVYKMDRSRIVENLEAIISYPKFVLNKSLFKSTIPLYLSSAKISFADCYLAASAESHNTNLLTFDKDLNKNVESVVLVG